MRTIRRNVFETNSSSSHSISISTETDWEAFKNGQRWVDYRELLTFEEAVSRVEEYYPEDAEKLRNAYAAEDMEAVARIMANYEFCSYKKWEELREDYGEETYSYKFTTPSGDKMVAWGSYGYNG